MGVSGCGKSTLGENIAKALGIPFYDGDDLHPRSNVEKMSHNIPLTDADREPWLALIRSTADRICERKINEPNEGPEYLEEVKGVVIACSALKKSYRDILRGTHPKGHEPPPAEDLPGGHPIIEHVDPETEKELLEKAASRDLRTFFVYINGRREVLEERMKARKGHFMKVEMLNSQLQTLEDPTGEDGVVVVELDEEMDKQTENAVKGLEELGFHEQHTRPVKTENGNDVLRN